MSYLRPVRDNTRRGTFPFQAQSSVGRTLRRGVPPPAAGSVPPPLVPGNNNTAVTVGNLSSASAIGDHRVAAVFGDHKTNLNNVK